MTKWKKEYDLQRLKNRKIVLRVTEEDLEKIKRLSKKTKMTMNEFIMKRTLKDKFESVKKIEVTLSSEGRNEIRRIANNLNQITRKYNATHDINEIDECGVIDKIFKVNEKLIEAMRGVMKYDN